MTEAYRLPGRALATRLPDFETLLRRALLAISVATPCLLGFSTSYILLGLVILASGYLVQRGQPFVLDLPGKVLLACFAVIAGVIVLNARRPFDLIFIVNFLAFAAYAPFATVFSRAASPRNAEIVANLALAGAAIGFGFGVIDRMVFHAERAGSFTTDPIRLADTALIVGFLSLIGILTRRDARRWIYLLGPVLALATIYLSGSRGALLAFTPMVVAAAFLLVRHKVVAFLVGAGLIAVFAIILTFTDLAGLRAATLLQILADLANGSSLGDEGTRIRFELYQAGWQAFQESPLIGHGWARMMSSLLPYLSEADKVHASLPHLHNEFLNFAVFGGLAGIAVYVALLALPVTACLMTPRDGQFSARLYGCALLTVSYFMLGLPDTMLSFELHTALYVALTAILLSYCRDPEPSA